jgi:hypothetical protein
MFVSYLSLRDTQFSSQINKILSQRTKAKSKNLKPEARGPERRLKPFISVPRPTPL